MGLLDSIAGGATQLIGGAVGVNTADMPELEKAKLDPYTKQILDQRVTEANAPTDQTEKSIVEQQNRGVGSGSQLLSGGGIDSPMHDALQARQNRQFNSATNKIKRTDQVNAPAERFSRLAGTLGAVRNDAHNAMKFAQDQKLASQNQMFAENNALASILGTYGSFLGSAVGGPGGGALGGAAGRSVARANGPGGKMGYLSGGGVPE